MLNDYEIEALAVKTEAERNEILATLTLSRVERRKLDKAIAEAHGDKMRYANKVTTRADVVNIMALYIERNILPFGQRMDAIERYIRFLELPFYKRWWVRLSSLIDRFIRWLDVRFGIKLVSMEETDEDVQADNHATD